MREVHVLIGPSVDAVLDFGEEIEADLIVVGSRGHGPIGRLLLGSVSEGVVHYATRPVLGLRGGEDAWPPGRVVIGDDGSETARKTAELVVSIGKLCGARGALVRAYAEMPEIDAGGRISDPRLVDDALRRAERELEKHAEKLERTLGMRPRVEVAVGDAAAALLEKAREEGETSTLIVVGRRGLGLAKRLRIGSASTKVLRAAEGPVLVHPGAGRAIL